MSTIDEILSIWPESLAAARSEAAAIDFRRRFDQVRAVRTRTEQIWPEIDELSAYLVQIKQSKWNRFWIAVFVILLVVDYWISPTGEFRTNWAKITNFIIFMSFLNQAFTYDSTKKKLETLQSIQRDLQYKWEECGAELKQFLRLRDFQHELKKIDDSAKSPLGEEWRKQHNEIEKKIELLWHEIQITLVTRAGGEVPRAHEHLIARFRDNAYRS